MYVPPEWLNNKQNKVSEGQKQVSGGRLHCLAVLYASDCPMHFLPIQSGTRYRLIGLDANRGRLALRCLLSCGSSWFAF